MNTESLVRRVEEGERFVVVGKVDKVIVGEVAYAEKSLGNYPPDLDGFPGVYEAIVRIKPKYQGQGFGLKLWEQAELEFQIMHPGAERATWDWPNEYAGWATHNLPQVIRCLEDQGYRVEVTWECNIEGEKGWVWKASR